MKPSARAAELAARNEGAAMTFWSTQTVENYETLKATRSDLLDYLAALESVAAAAREMTKQIYAPSLTNDVKAALKALDTEAER